MGQVDGRRVRGERTRAALLDAAVSLASVDGLDGLSLARLAAERGVSKSALFAHWPDKEALQLAAIDYATEQWRQHIVEPALRHPPGVRRLFALHEARLAFYAHGVLPGGCFFHAAHAEFDDRPGQVHDLVADALHRWIHYLRAIVTDAVTRGELLPDTDAAQLAFEIEALGEAVVSHGKFGNRRTALAFSRRAVLERLRALCTDPTLLPPR